MKLRRSAPADSTLIFVVFHGGGFFSGSPVDQGWWAEQLSDIGPVYLVEYSTFANNYGNVDEAIEDALDSVRYLSDRHPGKKFVLMGFSAGGILAFWTARFLGDRCMLLVLCSAVYDLAEGGFHNSMIPRAGRADLSPIQFLNEIEVPVLAFHGERDPVVPVQQCRDFAVSAEKAGVDINVFEVPNVGHGFSKAARALALAARKL